MKSELEMEAQHTSDAVVEILENFLENFNLT